jgi:alanine dehydrogenase
MEFGIPKEVREAESRVGLAPAGVLGLTQAGHTVYVQKGAGAGAGFSDEDYRQAGGHVVFSAAEAYGRADVVVKVARPTAQEHTLFRPGQIIFAFFHLQVSSPDLLAALREREITAVANEMIEDQGGHLPVLLPMSVVAGRLAPIIAGQLLMNTHGGRGTLLSGIPSVPRGSVTIVGAGTLGINAARAFAGLGAQVLVLDRDMRQLQRVDNQLCGRVTTMLSNKYTLRQVTEFTDVLVGCVQRPGHRAEKIITRNMVKRMRPGSVIIDFSIDDGGCVETSRPTTLRDPVFIAEQVTHYCVPNTPACVARTTSYGLTNALLPYLLMLVEQGIMGMLDNEPGFVRGINVYQGKLAHPYLATALGQPLEINLPSGGNK